MSTSRALRAALAAAGALALAACDPALMAGSQSRATVNVAGEAITVTAPPGFCIDRSSTRVEEAGAFVLMSDCALVAGSRGGGSPVGVALTASISAGDLSGEGDAGVQTLADLADFIGTAEGQALLGRSGQRGGVRVLASQEQGDVLYVYVEDRGPQPIAGSDPRFWRAFLEVEDRIAVLSVLGFEGAEISPQEQLNLLAGLAGALQRDNRR